MSNDCNRARELIELSLSRELPPDERSTVERHCRICTSCRRYREDLIRDDALLGELATRDTHTVREIERTTIAAITEAAREPAPLTRPRGIRAALPTFVRIAAVAAAAVAILVLMDSLRVPRQAAAPAFASVIETIEKADNLVLRSRYWALGAWREITIAEARPDLFRRSGRDTIFINSGNVALRLYPAERRAVLWKYLTDMFPERRENPIDRLANYYKRSEFSFVRRERLNGKSTLVYEGRMKIKNGVKMTAWVDSSSKLPLRMTFTRPPGAWRLDQFFSYGLRVEDFAPPGTKSSKIAGWVNLEEGMPHCIYEYRWNQKFDPSYFSVEPPKGYTVEEHSYADTLTIDSILAHETPYAVRHIVEGLKAWTELTSGRFPDSVQELADSAHVRSLLLTAFDKNERPGDEYRAARRNEARIWWLSSELKRLGGINGEYIGAGATSGDSTRIICWLKQHSHEHITPAKPYWIIFSDFHYEGTAAPPKGNRR